MKSLRCVFVLLILGALSATACSHGEGPPRSRAETRMFDRTVSKIGFVDLYVKDARRAKKVKAVYARIEKSFIALQEKRMKSAAVALGMSAQGEPTDAEVRDAFVRVNHVTQEVFREYGRSQIELRALLTEEEFTALDGVR